MLLSFVRPAVAAAGFLVAGSALAQAPAPSPVAPPLAGQQATPRPAQPAAPAATPGQLAAARDLIATTGTLSTVDEMIPAFAQEVRKQVTTRPDLQKDLEEVLKGLQPELDAQRRMINDQVAATYARLLTEQEMRDTIAFFKTPSGSKYINVQPQLIEEVVTQVGNWADQMSEYMLTRTRAEMSKRGHAMQ